MSSKSDSAIVYTLKNEGGFVDDPADHGGATNYGITEATYAKFKGHAVTRADVKAMPLADAIAIYKSEYWDHSFEMLDVAVATAIFDWGVLHGPANAKKLAQTCANQLGCKLVVDGQLGPSSIAALNSLRAKTFVTAFVAGMKEWFKEDVAKNPSQARFLAGWDNRADRLNSLV